MDVVESTFRIDGVLSHQVVFVYAGRLDPEPEPEQSGVTLTESDGSAVPVAWRPFDR